MKDSREASVIEQYLFFTVYSDPNAYVCICVEEEQAENGMTTGWSLHVNSSDSNEHVARKGGRGGSEVVSKAPSQMDCVSVSAL